MSIETESITLDHDGITLTCVVNELDEVVKRRRDFCLELYAHFAPSSVERPVYESFIALYLHLRKAQFAEHIDASDSSVGLLIHF